MALINTHNMEQQQPLINPHNKAEYPPMHTAEHILNSTMVKMFGCPRSTNAHIERKKSKCDYLLTTAPSPEQISQIEAKVNEVIQMHLPVTVEYMQRELAASLVDLRKLPANATDTLRIVKVGDYDACACAGDHVANTSEVAPFKIISADFTKEAAEEMGRWRVRFKLEE